MEKDIRELVLEVSMGVVGYNMILAIGASILFPQASVYLGLLVGMAAALVMFANMALTFSKAVRESSETAARRKTTLGVIFRSVGYLVLLVVLLWKVPQINILAVACGALGLKVGAYLQPLIHKFRAAALARKTI